VEQVTLKALAKEPEDRFASAGALAATLKEAVSEAGTETLETPPPAAIEGQAASSEKAFTPLTSPLKPETVPDSSTSAPDWRSLPWKWIAAIGGLVILVVSLIVALTSGGSSLLAFRPTPTATLPPNEWGFPDHLWVIWNGLDDEGKLGDGGPVYYRSNYSRQTFAGGFMLWWDNPDGADHIWVLGLGQQADGGDNWSRYDNTWTPDDPILPPDCPEAQEPFGPMMGFGKVWCDNPSVKDGIGGAQEKETASNDAIVQFFEKGVRFYFPVHQEIWMLHFDGTWKKYD
jgi:hypothetical protein